LKIGIRGLEESIQPKLHSPDVVDQNVHPPVLFDGASHQTIGCRRVQQVQIDGRDVLEPFKTRRAPGSGHDERSLIGQGLSDGLPDALSGSGHDRNLVLQHQVHGESPWWPPVCTVD
jgi:hypothetical protein